MSFFFISPWAFCVFIYKITSLMNVSFLRSFDNYPDTIEVDGSSYDTSLWDTAGQEEYDHIRILSYPNVNLLNDFTNCYFLN